MGEDGLEGGIDGSVFGVLAVVEGDGFFVGFGFFVDSDDGFGGLGDGGVCSGADGGEDGCAECCAFADIDGDNGGVVHVGLELSPEGGASAAAGGADLIDGDVHGAEDGDLFAHAEGDAFDDGAEEVGAGVARGEADEAGAGGGVGVGAAFAGEVREEEEGFTAGWNSLGFGDHFGIEGTGVFGAFHLNGEEGVAEILEGATGGEHAAEDAPSVGNGVAHGVDAAEGVGLRGVAGGEDDTGGSHGGGDEAA